VTLLYDAKDRIVSETDGAGRTAIATTYNGQGHATDIVQGSLHKVQTWDGRDRLSSIADAAGRSKTFGFDGADRVTSVTNGVGGVDHFAYDGEGGLKGVTQPSGAAHTLSLDGSGYLTGYTPPGGAGTQTITRDDDGVVTAANQGAGHSLTVGHDASG